MKVMNRKSFFIIFVLIFTLVFTGCNAETTTQPQDNSVEPNQNEASQELKGDHFELLQKATAEFLKENSFETISTEEVYQKVVLEGDLSYFVVDVRAADAFAEGNIEGSVNIPYELTAKPNMIANLPKDKKIVVVCYSGHLAGQTTALWKMLGYDAVTMLNGMGGWKTGAGSALGQFDFPVTTEVSKTGSFNLPSLKFENVSDLQSLIIAGSQSFLNSGKGPIVNAPTLKDKLGEYFPVDIRSPQDYAKGHIEGAVNIPAQSLAELDNLKKVPADKKVVIIGYTGNDASMAVRALNQLGYDSYALFQGMRVWTNDEAINGIAPASTEVVPENPVKPLDYDLDGGGGGTASCG